MKFSLLLENLFVCLCAFESSWKGQHQWLVSYPVMKNMYYICILLCHMIKAKVKFWMMSSKRGLKSWEQVMLRMHEFLEWISKTAAIEPSFHSLWVLAFLKRSIPKLKTVFESSLLHKLAVTSHTMVGNHMDFEIMDPYL